MTAALVIAAAVGGLLTLILAVGVAAALGRAAADADVYEGHACPTCRSHRRDLRITWFSHTGPQPCTDEWHHPTSPTPPDPWSAR